jgi:hypothetical protein
MIVLDPNSDYVHLDELSDPTDDDAARVAELERRVCVFRAGPDASYRLKARFGRLPLTMKAQLLALDPLRDAEEYDVLRAVSEGMDTSEYSPRDLRGRLDDAESSGTRRLALRMDNLGVLDWSIWAAADEPPLLDQLPPDWRAAVIDLGGLPTAAERSAVSAAILSGLWDRRHQRRPTLLVIDEAHNVCPQVPTDHNQALAVQRTIDIAAEGRKFGLYLLLATQRPQKLHINVLTQCENLVLMRLNSQADIAHLASTFSHVPAALVAQAAGFELGEGLVAGRIVPCPLLFRTGPRRSPEGGSDVPTTWAGRAVRP